MTLAPLLAVMAVGATPDGGVLDLDLELDTQRVIQIPPRARLQVHDPAVVELRHVGDDQALVIGKAPGTTRVTATAGATRVRWRVTVRAFDAQKIVAQVVALVGDIKGLVITLNGHCPNLECFDCSAADEERVGRVRALHPCVSFVDRISPGRREVSTTMAGVRRILGEGGADTPGVVLDVRNGRVVLSGETRSAEDAARIRQVREAFPEVLVDARLLWGAPDAAR